MFVNKEAVGKRILQIRKKYGYSMQKFGEIIDNAPKGSVNSWEKGVNLPNEKRLKQIATLGNMTLNELLYGSFKEYVDMLITEKLGIELPEEFTRTFYSLLEQNGFTYGDDIEIVRLVNGFLTIITLQQKKPPFSISQLHTPAIILTVSYKKRILPFWSAGHMQIRQTTPYISFRLLRMDRLRK